MILRGDALSRLRRLPSESVDCIVTSPPYWGLRDYGVPGQIGLEPSPYEFIETMVRVFSECRRVLKPHGSLWLNLGDTYATGGGTVGRCPGGGAQGARWIGHARSPIHGKAIGPVTQPNRMPIEGLKEKELIGVPWRVAFALQADGWFLRTDIVWEKPNCMPESVRDRPTRSHEFLFLLTKSRTYYYDRIPILEPVTGNAHTRGKGTHPKSAAAGSGIRANAGFAAAVRGLVSMRNKRTVWRVPTRPFKGAHFATFPADLVRPCILAGTSERGVCSRCGAPWRRITRPILPTAKPKSYNGKWAQADPTSQAVRLLGNIRARREMGLPHDQEFPVPETLGWAPSCKCRARRIAATVLDPFAGSGTTLMVAEQLGRRGIGIELNPAYVRLAEARLAEAFKRAEVAA
jgi:DNA modification methylase